MVHREQKRRFVLNARSLFYFQPIGSATPCGYARRSRRGWIRCSPVAAPWYGSGERMHQTGACWGFPWRASHADSPWWTRMSWHRHPANPAAHEFCTTHTFSETFQDRTFWVIQSIFFYIFTVISNSPFLPYMCTCTTLWRRRSCAVGYTTKNATTKKSAFAGSFCIDKVPYSAFRCISGRRCCPVSKAALQKLHTKRATRIWQSNTLSQKVVFLVR